MQLSTASLHDVYRSLFKFLEHLLLLIIFFCTLCVSKVPQVLSNYEIVDKLEIKVVSVVKESIASQMSTNFESAKLGQFKDAYCKLQKSVEEISAKISNLSQQNSNL